MPRVFSIMVVKNEVDVLRECVLSAAEWSHSIHVLDNGSTDGSWEELQQLSGEIPNVEVVGRDPARFSDAVRARIFGAARSEARPGDWWWRLDADEFPEDPRPLLAEVPSRFDTVHASYFQYYLTASDVAERARDPETWDRRPVTERLRWYRNDHAARRAVRHLRWMRWRDTMWPEGVASVFPERARLRHYKYRSPAQIETRLRIRMEVAETFPHEQQGLDIFEEAPPGSPIWRQRLARTDMLDYDDGTTGLTERPELLPGLPSPPGALRHVVDRALVISGGWQATRKLRRPGGA
ncbi:MAG TPA: glycosyltransferase family 2 protein [Acidimicrobiales bacterium]|nr:glycosyltransferase family 2 protein [Acidimicrobiales bacterium]